MDNKVISSWSGVGKVEAVSVDEEDTAMEQCLVGTLIRINPLTKLGSEWLFSKLGTSSKTWKWKRLTMIALFFSFPSAGCRQRVLDQSPWTIKGFPLLLKPLMPNETVQEVDLTSFPVWVQVHGLPMGQATRGMAESATRRIGEVMEVDFRSQKAVWVTQYIRVKVLINIQQALSPGPHKVITKNSDSSTQSNPVFSHPPRIDQSLTVVVEPSGSQVHPWRRDPAAERKETIGASRASGKEQRVYKSDMGAGPVRAGTDLGREVSDGQAPDGRDTPNTTELVGSFSYLLDKVVSAEKAWLESLEHELDLVRLIGKEKSKDKEVVDEELVQVIKAYKVGQAVEGPLMVFKGLCFSHAALTSKGGLDPFILDEQPCPGLRKAKFTAGVKLKAPMEDSQKINKGKSAIFCSRNTHPDMVRGMCSTLDIRKMDLGSKYLRLPLFIGRSKKRAFEDVKEKVFSKVADWKMRTLSQAEHTTLIKAVATAMPLYCMSTFLLPKCWCLEIDRLLKDFWWGFPSHKKRNFTPRAWEAICLPKDVGGLGMRKMYETNLALVAKMGWKFYSSPDSLWVRLAKLKYPNQTPLSHSDSIQGSVIWRGILQFAPLLRSGLCLKPRIGRSILLQGDPWLPGRVDCMPEWRDEALLDSNIRFVSDLVLEGENRWNDVLIHHLFSAHSARDILRMQVPTQELHDWWLWKKEQNGMYSVKYVVLAEQCDRASGSPELSSFSWSKLWKLNLQDRLKFFLWKVAVGVLKTRGLLGRIL
ncbi:hypothetical protein CJ030_MR6G005862 [Morella rubra]|uniref:Uncharacterized protein n=1 Tax=Morella rubra TaxID=262757 RepID=A0A6A1V7M8_9ROSI|nr:hypothetical protein CJ030_MR6G005862 [Morella rubra]